MSTQAIFNLPRTIFGQNRERRRIHDLERILRFDQAERVIHRNNLHTHMLRVSYLSHDLALHLQNNNGLQIDPAKTQRLALYHDDPEVITGDIPTPIKYSMKQHERLQLRKAEEEATKILATRYFGINPLNQRRRQYLQDQRDMTRKESVEARIVNIADKMEGLCETIHEIRCGNDTFYQILDNYRSFFESFIGREPLFEIINTNTTYKVTLESIPTIKQSQTLRPITYSLYKTNHDAFWKSVFEENLPGFYKKWLNITVTKLSFTALFPGWNVSNGIKPYLVPSS